MGLNASEARAACAGTNSEKRCAIKSICANRPSAMPDTSVMNWKSRHSCLPGSGRAAADGMKTAAAPRLSRSGVKPICWGVLDQGFPDVRRRAELTALFCLDVGTGSPCHSRRKRGRHEGAGFPVIVEQLDDLTEVQHAALTAALAGKGSANEAIARWSTSRSSIQSPR